MFWSYDIKKLLIPILILNNNMTEEEKLNTIMRIIIFSGIIAALILNKYNILLLVFILLLILILIYKYIQDNKYKKENFLDENNLDFIDNKICISPTYNNPLMNFNILNKNSYNNELKPCSISNKNIENKITDILNNSLNLDNYNVYNQNYLDKIFYTMPNTNIPNEQDEFAKWLYKDYNVCKSDGGIECYNNIYSDLRLK